MFLLAWLLLCAFKFFFFSYFFAFCLFLEQMCIIFILSTVFISMRVGLEDNLLLVWLVFSSRNSFVPGIICPLYCYYKSWGDGIGGCVVDLYQGVVGVQGVGIML